MHNYIQFLHYLHVLSFSCRKIPENDPRRSTPPRRWHLGVATAWLHLQHARARLPNILDHHATLMTNVCIAVHSDRSTRSLHRNLSPTPFTLWSKWIFRDSECSQFFCSAYLHHRNQACQISIGSDGLSIFWIFFRLKCPKNVRTWQILPPLLKLVQTWHAALTWQHQVPAKIWDRSELVVKSTCLKRGSQTSPEGSISEHLHFSTINISPHIFLHTHMIKSTSHAQLYTISTIFTFSFIFL